MIAASIPVSEKKSGVQKTRICWQARSCFASLGLCVFFLSFFATNTRVVTL